MPSTRFASNLLLISDCLSDDVLKARLKTVGVAEYKFEMEVSAGRDSGTEWRIVDVGGSRSQVCTMVSLLALLAISRSIDALSCPSRCWTCGRILIIDSGLVCVFQLDVDSDVSDISEGCMSSQLTNRCGWCIATWVPFFDDVDAIIFLAPISAFDQVLTEDKTVNRLVRPPSSLLCGLGD